MAIYQIYWRTTNQNSQGGVLFGVQDIDKAKVTMRLPGFHERIYWGYDVLNHFMVKHAVLPKTSGKAWIYGANSNVKVENGRIDAETAEKLFGIDVAWSGNTATFSMGDGTLTFTEGQKNYDANGTAVATDTVVLSNGYFDIESLCGIFGKVYKETEKSYIIMHNTEAVDVYQNMIESFI